MEFFDGKNETRDTAMSFCPTLHALKRVKFQFSNALSMNLLGREVEGWNLNELHWGYCQLSRDRLIPNHLLFDSNLGVFTGSYSTTINCCKCQVLSLMWLVIISPTCLLKIQCRDCKSSSERPNTSPCPLACL
jgi:hypothetical protein